jgi:hypothetical protein
MSRLISLVLLTAGCTEASIMPMAPPEGTDDTDVAVDTDTTPPSWSLVVQNNTSQALDRVQVCFDEARFDCLELGAMEDHTTATHTSERFDVTRLDVYGFDQGAQQWYRVSEAAFTPVDEATTTLTLEALACGMYEGTKFYLTLHSAVIYPTTLSGAMWDGGVNWDNLDFITDVVDLAVTEYAGDSTGDLAATIADGLGESLDEVTNGTTPPDMVYHLGTYGQFTEASVAESKDGFPNALTTLHDYDRGESNDPAQANTIFPIFDDTYLVQLPTDQKLYVNAYDVDTIGSERIGGLSLEYDKLASYADCGRLGNVTGTELLMGMAVTVQSMPTDGS